MKFNTHYLLSLLTLLYANTAMAKYYECKTTQVVGWEKGHLVSKNSHNYAWIHAVIHFNDDTGELWTAMNEDSPFNYLPFKILKKMDADKEFFAIFDESNKIHTPAGDILNNPSVGSSFRLRGWDKDTGIIFLFDSTATQDISTGVCHISKPYP